MVDQISPARDNATDILRWAAIAFAIGFAPEAAIAVGFGSAVVFTYAHLLPTFLPGYQDSFISPPHINVTWFSWFSALTEIGTGIVFAIAGIRARRSLSAASHTPPPPYCVAE
jgi:hypothetical protein